MKNLTFKQVVGFEAKLVVAIYTIMVMIEELTKRHSFMDSVENMIEALIEPEVLTYMVVTWFALVIATTIFDLFKGFFFWLEIQKFNRRK